MFVYQVLFTLLTFVRILANDDQLCVHYCLLYWVCASVPCYAICIKVVS